MAHYKRRRPRGASSGYYSRKGLRNRMGEAYSEVYWLSNWPRWWDKLHHTAPARREAHRLEHEVMRGADADNICWPDGRKPHNYYW